MDLMLLPIMGFVFSLVETLILFGIVYAIFCAFEGKQRIRNWVFYLASYPGVFAAASGWLGIVVPVPAILGAPFWLFVLSKTNDASWVPAPFLTISIGFEGPERTVAAFFIGEIMLIVAWLIVVIPVHKRTRLPPKSA